MSEVAAVMESIMFTMASVPYSMIDFMEPVIITGLLTGPSIRESIEEV